MHGGPDLAIEVWDFFFTRPQVSQRDLGHPLFVSCAVLISSLKVRGAVWLRKGLQRPPILV